MNSTEPTNTTQGSRRSRKHLWTGLFFGTLGIVVVVVAVLFFVLLVGATESQQSFTRTAPKEAIDMKETPFGYCYQNYSRSSPYWVECIEDVAILRPNRRFHSTLDWEKLKPNFPTPIPTPTPPNI